MTNAFTTEYWRRCSSCKNPIAYRATHFVCSVSTCTRKRVGYVFCSVHCWERHLPGARHRDAAAIEAVAPNVDQWRSELEAAGELGDAPPSTPTPSTSIPSDARAPQRVMARPASASARPPTKDPLESEVLVVASKLKAYIRARSEMNTSDSVMDALSNRMRRLCDRAIDNARADGRKTVMDRDFE